MTAKGKHSPPGKGNIYAKANEVIVKITGGDTAQTFEVVEENCKPGFQSRAHYHIKAYETFYLFDGIADMHALTQDQLMNAELTRQLALKHDTVMIEQSKDGRGKGTILG